MKDKSVTRLREMQREVRIRCSDLRARGIQGSTDNIDSKLSKVLGPMEDAQIEHSEKKAPKRTESKNRTVKLPTTATPQDPSTKGPVPTLHRRSVQRVDGRLPFHRKQSYTSTPQQCDLYSFASFIGGHLKRSDGRLPWRGNVFATQPKSSPLNACNPGTNHGTILDNLSDEQRNAVLVHPSKGCLVLAGPGSGKTRVLTHRFAYLAKAHGISPHKILAVTFTNKAASEMSERIVKLLYTDNNEEEMETLKRKLTVGTFHSISARLLRKYGERIGVPREFDVCDSADSRSILKRIMKSSESMGVIDPKTVGRTLAMISKIKNCRVEGEALMKPFLYKKFSELRNMYDEALKRAKQLDFDDLLIETRRLLEDCPDVLEELRDRYEHVLVDEWQDTNRAQFDIISLLAGRRSNLFVVGDADQSIYKFRGADSRNLQSFSEAFPEADRVTLERNYRSSRCIVEAAQSVINEDKKRPPKSMTTANEFGNKVVVQQTLSCRHEAMFVVTQLKHLKARGELERFSDAAVMYRTNAQSRQLEEAFMRADLPYRLNSGVRFYERAEIKDIVGFIKLISNTSDDVSFRRIVNTPPRGIGKTTIGLIEQYAEKENISLVDAVSRMVRTTQQNADDLSLRPQTVRSLTCFCNLLHDLRRSACTLSVDGANGAMADSRNAKDQLLNVGDLVASVCEKIEYREYINARDHDDLAGVERKLQREANVDELIQSASRHKDIREFLETVALMSNVDHNDQSVESAPVSFMTLHSGKGLEFKAVFIVGAEDDVIPNVKHQKSLQDEIDEERRLFYVGMTRAKCFLYVTWRKSKLMITKNGVMKNSVPTSPSRFLNAIPQANFSSLTTTN